MCVGAWCVCVCVWVCVGGWVRAPRPSDHKLFFAAQGHKELRLIVAETFLTLQDDVDNDNNNNSIDNNRINNNNLGNNNNNDNATAYDDFDALRPRSNSLKLV